MKGKNAEYQEKLDHLRFFAAFLIIIYHSVLMFQKVCNMHPLCKLNGGPSSAEPPFFSLILEGHTAVALFMTLSGFLFATICKGKEIDHWKFYRNRFLRIYPLFVSVLLIACYLDPHRITFVNFLTSLFFMQNTYSAVIVDNCTESLWAIAVEFQFYLLFPWLLIFFRKYGYKYLLGLVGLAFLIRLTAHIAELDLYMLSYLTIFGRIDQFLIGMIYGFSFDEMKARLSHPVFLIASVACTLAFIFCMHSYGWSKPGPHWIWACDLEALLWGFVIVAYNASSFRFSKGITRLLAFGGTLSYSLYLIHPFVMRLAYWFAPLVYAPHNRYPLLAQMSSQLSHQSYFAGLVFGLLVAFPVTFIVAMLTYRFIEKPFLELRSTYTLGGKPKDDEQSTVTGGAPRLAGATRS